MDPRSSNMLDTHFVIEMQSQPSLDFETESKWPGQVLNFWSSCHHLPSSGTSGFPMLSPLLQYHSRTEWSSQRPFLGPWLAE